MHGLRVVQKRRPFRTNQNRGKVQGIARKCKSAMAKSRRPFLGISVPATRLLTWRARSGRRTFWTGGPRLLKKPPTVAGFKLQFLWRAWSPCLRRVSWIQRNRSTQQSSIASPPSLPLISVQLVRRQTRVGRRVIGWARTSDLQSDMRWRPQSSVAVRATLPQGPCDCRPGRVRGAAAASPGLTGDSCPGLYRSPTDRLRSRTLQNPHTLPSSRWQRLRKHSYGQPSRR